MAFDLPVSFICPVNVTKWERKLGTKKLLYA